MMTFSEVRNAELEGVVMLCPITWSRKAIPSISPATQPSRASRAVMVRTSLRKMIPITSAAIRKRSATISPELRLASIAIWVTGNPRPQISATDASIRSETSATLFFSIDDLRIIRNCSIPAQKSRPVCIRTAKKPAMDG